MIRLEQSDDGTYIEFPVVAETQERAREFAVALYGKQFQRFEWQAETVADDVSRAVVTSPDKASTEPPTEESSLALFARAQREGTTVGHEIARGQRE